MKKVNLLLLLSLLFLFTKCSTNEGGQILNHAGTTQIETQLVGQILSINKNFNNSKLNKSKFEKDFYYNKNLKPLFDQIKLDKKVNEEDFNKIYKGYNEDFNKIQKTIFQEYFNLIKENNKINPLLLNSYFKSQLNELEIDNSSLEIANNFINYHHDLFMYLNLDEDLSDNQYKRWASCAHRDCLDCCMYRKLQDVEDSNLFDQILFIGTAAEQTAYMVMSCGYDCW